MTLTFCTIPCKVSRCTGDYSAERLAELQRNTIRLPPSRPAAEVPPPAAAPEPAFKLSGSFKQANAPKQPGQVNAREICLVHSHRLQLIKQAKHNFGAFDDRQLSSLKYQMLMMICHCHLLRVLLAGMQQQQQHMLLQPATIMMMMTVLPFKPQMKIPSGRLQQSHKCSAACKLYVDFWRDVKRCRCRTTDIQ